MFKLFLKNFGFLYLLLTKLKKFLSVFPKFYQIIAKVFIKYCLYFFSIFDLS